MGDRASGVIRRLKAVAAGLGMAVAAMVFPSVAAACSCVAASNPTPAHVRKAVQDELNRSAVVFVGEVVTVDQFEAMLKVETVWKDKDKAPETVRMLQARRMPDGTAVINTCDYTFKTGAKYLVFANPSTDGGFRAFHCGFTAPVAAGEVTIRILDELVKRDAVSAVSRE